MFSVIFEKFGVFKREEARQNRYVLDQEQVKYFQRSVRVSSKFSESMRYCVQFENHAIEIALIRVNVMS